MAKLDIINIAIEKLANAERITKSVLAELSRSLLEYVLLDSGKGEPSYDIDAVNRTLAVLTPMNKRTAALYFPNFLPFSFDEETCTFGKMNKKAKEKKTELVKQWLNTDTNNIWVWADANVEIKKKPVDYAAQITKYVAKGLADEDNGIDVVDVMKAVLSADGITIADVLVTMEHFRVMMDTQGEEALEDYAAQLAEDAAIDEQEKAA